MNINPPMNEHHFLVVAFTPIHCLQNDAEFIWGAEQQDVFEEIKEYLSTLPVLKASQSRAPTSLYVAAENDVIRAVLTQEAEGKEHIITYVS
jgi:hypothetical protein